MKPNLQKISCLFPAHVLASTIEELVDIACQMQIVCKDRNINHEMHTRRTLQTLFDDIQRPGRPGDEVLSFHLNATSNSIELRLGNLLFAPTTITKQTYRQFFADLDSKLRVELTALHDVKPEVTILQNSEQIIFATTPENLEHIKRTSETKATFGGGVLHVERVPEPMGVQYYPSTVKGRMTKEELFALHESTCRGCLETMKRKNADYSAGEDPLRNFRNAEVYGTDPVTGILIRIGDKMQRVQSFVTIGSLKVSEESAIDSIDDAINYLILAKGLLVERAKMKSSQSE